MMRMIVKRKKWKWMPALAAAAMVWAGGGTIAADDKHDRGQEDGTREAQPTKSAPWEVAIGGITVEKRMAQQSILRAELTAEMPDGAMDDPIGVEVTDRDRADLYVPVIGEPLRIGVVKGIDPSVEVVNGQIPKVGVFEKTQDGGFVWAMAVTSPGARGIRVHFTDFSLPPNAEVYFFNLYAQAHGPYTGTGRNGNGDFWTRSISSDTGVIQLRYIGEPTEADRQNMSFVISELGHIAGQAQTRDTWPCGDNVACLEDAMCISGTPADPAKDAIAKMEWIIGQYIYTCTGGLIADTVTATQIPYFLTANHCDVGDTSNLETWFNYTTDSCEGTCPGNLVFGGTPPPSDTIGTSLVVKNSVSDFCLLTLNEDPPAGAVFLGWNNTAIAYTDGVDLWRISNANFGPQVYSTQEVDTASPTCTGLDRGNIIYSLGTLGATMGGSSGSPVVNSSSEIVGQLYGCCGYNCGDECDLANNWTIDGAFAVTWPYVEQYLDPAGGCTSDAECDDNLYCNGAEWCDIPSGDCQPGTAPNCNDGVTCTDDSCNEGTDSCDNVANDGNCDNGQWCDGDEWCHATSDCQAGTAPDCNDGVGCTDDSCNEGSDSCDNVANDGNCDNGLFCDGAETCHSTLDCQAGSDPCPGQVCDEVNDVCCDCEFDADCDDGLWCNGAETCDGCSCQAGTAPNCSDGVGCTDDSCNEGTDSCDNVANDANCDNGLYCDGAETCHVTLDCQSGTAVDCDDGVGCTDDSCNEGTDSCDNTPNNSNCDNGLFCDGAETCHSTLDCQAGSDPCPGQTCDEVNDVCCECEFDADCDDGLFCTGVETCDGCSCVAGSDPCPGQTCNEDTDTCETVECTEDGDCDDGSDCTVDTCVDNVCYNDCPATVSTYPYTEGFESGFGDWANMGGDDMDWTRDSAGTPSSNTGPSSAHGGTYYVYTEASSPNYPTKTANLEGPCFDLANTSDAQMTFWYHMYGSAMGTLNVEVSDDCVTWTNVWNLTGDQGNTWYEANVDLSAYVGTTITIRFRGVTGSSWSSDMTVDDITVDVTPAQTCNNDPECDDGVFCNGSEVCVDNLCGPGTDPCPGQACDEGTDSCFTAECTIDGDCDDGNDCTVDTCVDYVCYNECPSTIDSFPYSEGFESGWGDWVNAAGDDMDWSRNSGSTPSSSTGPSSAHGGSYYIYTESSSPNYPSKTANIEGPCFDLTGASDTEMTFWYHMYGSAMGTLYLEASEDCAGWSTVWSLSGDQGNSWYQATVDLSAYDGIRLSLRFRGLTGSSYRSDMSVDDITITATVGPTCTVPADCDDGLYCNGAEDCVGGNCVAGTAVNCNDGVGCTDDTCNEGTDSCDNVANDTNCDNGLWCDGAEWCDDVSDCQVGTAPDCTDAVPCTVDTCNEGTDSCDNTPDDGYCDDGVYCNGAETCDAGAGCLPGTAIDCNDGVGCTDDSCNEGTDSCDNIANDAYCPDNGLFCDGDEFCDAVADCSSTGDPCSGGDVCNETTDVCDPGGGGAQMEAGSVSIGGTPVTVTLTNTYVSAVVACSVQYNNNTTPVVPRVTNVGSTSFDVYLQNPSGGAVATETVGCVVVEEGTWTIDGVNIEAQKYLSTVTDQNNSWVGDAQTYGQSYTNPVVIGQVMSDNDAMWSVFWCQGTARTNPPVASALKTGKTVAEDTDTTRADETVGFIVFEAGHGTIGGVAFEALVGADTVRGVTDSPPYTYTFNTSFSSVPTVAVTTMAGVDGGNGGWAYVHGATMATTTTLYLSIDEDQVGDSERNHTTEQVGYVVFESSLVYP